MISKGSVKVCLDSNVILSAIAFGGKPERILRIGLKEKGYHLVSSTLILNEVKKNLEQKIGMREQDYTHLFDAILYLAILSNAESKVSITGNKGDDNVLAICKDVKADFLVTGDKKHLLPIKKYNNTKIVSPAAFLDWYLLD